ncbi:GYF domain-containing protein [Agrilutibacter solisilvae]|uniref:DUF4339 domain-containing protein n=1 Tax=Agrilutibacter solisilvae TaxID=2763317 RepID=A0A974Y004_9GAMM|nr:GYF domain-containing protein [Lysobacter solisilvae]QSX78809.1 DUF4339 domain-containing protein [Lysobacter solisilvae]
MTTWFHHDPAQGRVGPFSTEQLLGRYRDRLILADTLVWREGAREWLPLARAVGEMEIELPQPDTSRPPPLPIHRAPAAAPPRAAGASYTAAPEKKRMSGCLIALLVAAGLSIPVIGILAAIALPAYQDYTTRAHLAQAIAESAPVREAMLAHVASTRACPGNGDPGFDDSARFASRHIEAVEFGVTGAGACSYTMTLRNSNGPANGSTVVMGLVTTADGYDFDYQCDAGTLPERAPITCRTAGKDPR